METRIASRTQVREPLLVLDRRQQRAMALQALKELIELPEQRVCCLIAYGGRSALVNEVSSQIYTYLRGNADDALIVTLNLALPNTPDFTVEELGVSLRRQLCLDEETPLHDFLLRQRMESAAGRQPVLLLNWQTRGYRSSPELDNSGLRAWVAFCADDLVAQCPDSLRLLSCLKLEGDKQGFEQVSQLMGKVVADATFPHDRCGLELLEHLDKVTSADLIRFLSDRQTNSCPPELRQEVSALILTHTHGDFEGTVDLLRRAEISSWRLLAEELRQSKRSGSR